MGHLARLGLVDHFDCIRTVEDVSPVKPAPDLYLAALDGLGVAANHAFAIEDSPNGVIAAQKAGLFCVAVLNDVSRLLKLDHADLILPSLDAVTLADLLAAVSRDHR